MIGIYRRIQNENNYATGTIVQDYEIFITHKEILVSKNGTLFTNEKAYKDFGANTDTSDVELLSDLEIKNNDIVYYETFKYSVISSTFFRGKWYVKLKAINDTDIFNAELNTLINAGWNGDLVSKIAIDEIIYGLNTDIVFNYKALPITGDTLDDAGYVLNGSNIDLSAYDSFDYSQFGLRSGLHNSVESFDTLLTLPNTFSLAFYARGLESTGNILSCGDLQISISPLAVTFDEISLSLPYDISKGTILLNVSTETISLYQDGTLVDTALNTLSSMPTNNIILNTVPYFGFFLVGDALNNVKSTLLSSYVARYCARLGR
jgi:hypothetical protein